MEPLRSYLFQDTGYDQNAEARDQRVELQGDVMDAKALE